MQRSPNSLPAAQRAQEMTQPGVGDPPPAEEQEGGSLDERLMAAAAAGDGSLIARLLAAGAAPAVETEEGVTPLMLAAGSGSSAAVQALLEAGAPWHAQDAGGNTAGEYASGGRHRDVVRQLLDWAVRAELLLGEQGGGAAVRRGSWLDGAWALHGGRGDRGVPWCPRPGPRSVTSPTPTACRYDQPAGAGGGASSQQGLLDQQHPLRRRQADG